MNVRRSPWVALALIVLLVADPARSGPAFAGRDPSRAYVSYVNRYCNQHDGVYADFGGQVGVWEIGKSGVTKFSVTFKTYRADVGWGFNFADLQASYSSPSFPNDGSNYATYLPTNGPHIFHNITVKERMVAKVKWSRSWRLPWREDVLVGYCQPSG